MFFYAEPILNLNFRTDAGVNDIECTKAYKAYTNPKHIQDYTHTHTHTHAISDRALGIIQTYRKNLIYTHTPTPSQATYMNVKRVETEI